MASLRFGSDNSGDSLCANQFCRYVIKHVLNCHDKFSYAELCFVRSLIFNIMKSALKIRDSFSNSIVLDNIVFNMKVFLENSVFKDCTSKEDIITNPVSYFRNVHIVKLFRMSRVLCDSFHRQTHAFDGSKAVDYSKSWGNKDMLIGSLKNREQLNICLEQNFYHAPKERINTKNIKYVAIYQSKNLFGKHAGIYYWAKVLKTEVVKRSEITQIPKNSSEDYYKFTVDKWYRRDKPIKATSEGALFGYTNLFMFFRAGEIFQLYYDDYEEYKFFSSLSKAIAEKYNNVTYKYKECDIYIKDGDLFICKNSKIIFNLKIADYCKNRAYQSSRIKHLFANLA